MDVHLEKLFKSVKFVFSNRLIRQVRDGARIAAHDLRFKSIQMALGARRGVRVYLVRYRRHIRRNYVRMIESRATASEESIPENVNFDRRTRCYLQSHCSPWWLLSNLLSRLFCPMHMYGLHNFLCFTVLSYFFTTWLKLVDFEIVRFHYW